MHLRIRDRREDADLSQKTKASCLFCSQQAYSTYDRGKREIPLSQLAGSLNMTMSASIIPRC